MTKKIHSVASFQYIGMDSNKTNGSLNKQSEITITFNNKSAWMYAHYKYLRIEFCC